MENIVLTVEEINAIQEFIREKRTEIKDQYPNILLRDDVLTLLDQYCKVIYYPLPEDKNNGFHINGMPLRNGTLLHFVFINTAQTIEKQVFTAAHELGHIWEVDNRIQRQFPDINCTPARCEHIINRFASELLMPCEFFKKKFCEEYQQRKSSNGNIFLLDMLRVVVILMNHFFVPFKAVVIRCQELSLINEAGVTLLLGKGLLSLNEIDNAVERVKNEMGYTHLIEPTNKRWIEGLPELLDQAQEQQVVPEAKIKELRASFDLKETPKNEELENCPFSTEEEH